MAVAASASGEALPVNPGTVAETLTNSLQVRRLASRREISGCSVRIEGVVLWVSPARDQLILQDDSGGLVLKMDLRKEAPVKAGQQILIEGGCHAGRGEIGIIPLIDNDGTHTVFEATGETFLSAGLHPISVEWFNGSGEFALAVDYQAPGMSLRPIPNAALFRTNADGSTNRNAPGLDFSCYEGDWQFLPD